MKATNRIAFAGAILLTLLCNIMYAQFGTTASAVSITDCNQSTYYNTSGNPGDLIGPAVNVFEGANLGVHTQNSGTLVLDGAQLKTFKNSASSNVCSSRMFYRVYLQSGVPGAFTSLDLPFFENCDMPAGTYPSGGTCVDGDQKWRRIISNNLTTNAPGNYVLEIYYEASGSQTSTVLCNDLVTLNNGGANYKAFFSIQSPTLSSTNPSSCFGNEGSITIGGLVAGATYQLTYTDDGVTVGPAAFTANGAGQLIMPGLNKGFYANFTLQINGCTTNLFTGIILSDPIFVPTFTSIPPFCAGTTAPTLPSVSNNGMAGTWSPAIVSNTASGSYTFTPDGNQCGFPTTINITVTPRTVPTFPFGTSLIICNNGTVPTLPNTSTNGVNGTWSPAVVDNQNSGVYTFTANPALCATGTTFSVTVNPNITPTFAFGSTLTICAGEAVPTLPGTSENGITGTWSPAVVDNQNSGNYTFTPTAGLCAFPTSFAVTVIPNAIPLFSFGPTLSICAGGSVPTLPNTSDNGITGTWNPAIVNNQASGSYIFTPSAGLCALPYTFTVTVNTNIPPSFPFGTSLVICNAGTVPVLPGTSTNGITGTWNPAVVDNQNAGSYTFTPDAGQCAIPATFTVTVNPNIPPAFSFGASLTICAGETVPALPNTSTNGITGTWSPAVVDNQGSGVYTFTPTPGLCATIATFTVTVNPNVIPSFSFGSSLTVCGGATAPSLPTTSTNGVSGSWSPAVVDNQNSGTYTFTPDAGLCATPVSFTVTVNPNIPPTFSFGSNLTICAGETVPALPNTSVNGITGTWSPAVVDDQNSNVYTFTPTPGLCAITATFTVTVNPIVTPAFSFGTNLAICTGASVPTLPATSQNGITGNWSPSVIDNQNGAVYTFTPAAGQCAVATTLTVVVSTNITPTFGFGTSLTICAGASVPTLPGTSANGITGSWSPSAVDNQNSGVYTFTPDAGLCATATTFSVTVNPNILPTFDFGTSLTICEGATAPVLPGTSINGISGTWSPSVVDNLASGVYTFTPTSGLCAVAATFTVTVNPNVTPVFSFGNSLAICAGGSVPTLPTTSQNGITGSWSPSVIDNQNSGSYTFTPNPGQCVTNVPVTLTVTVTPNIIPVFSFNNTLTICAGDAVPSLPSTSDNGIDGVWTPGLVSNQANGTYIFTPLPGQCVTTFTFIVIVNPIVTPEFTFGTFQSICIGGNVPVLPATSGNGIPGTWSPAVVDNQANGTYTFTPDAGQCAIVTTFELEVNAIPTVTVSSDTTVYDGAVVPQFDFITTAGADVAWTNSHPTIGLAASGVRLVPSFTAINKGNDPIVATITATPAAGGCSGVAQNYRITVLPLNKDVFVPNVFTPNRDGKNDILYVYGNYITKVDMKIFNQWGQMISSFNNQTQGWDGTHKGNPQPVGVYVYVLKAELSDGRTVNLKGSITLIR